LQDLPPATSLGVIEAYRAPRTLRIHNIPISVTKDTLRTVLEQLFDQHATGSKRESTVLELSLARYSGRSSCATVTLRNQPSSLTNDRDSYTVKLPGLIPDDNNGKDNAPIK
jgi:hypothetical protein